MLESSSDGLLLNVCLYVFARSIVVISVCCLSSSLSKYLLADQVRGEVHHDRRLHVLMLREEEMQWERGLSKPQYHTRWNSMLGEVHSSPTDSAGSLHAEYMNLPEAEEDQWAFFRSVVVLCKTVHLRCTSHPVGRK